MYCMERTNAQTHEAKSSNAQTEVIAERTKNKRADVGRSMKLFIPGFGSVPVPWPGLEIGFLWTIVIGAVTYAWLRLYQVSMVYDWQRQPAFFQKNRLWGFGEMLKDVSESEWNEWSHFAHMLLPFYFIHALLFNLTPKLMSRRFWSPMMLIYWLASCCFVVQPTTVLVAVCVGVSMYAVTVLTRSIMFVWVTTCCFLYLIADVFPEYLATTDVLHYAVMTFLTYKVVHFTSYCLDRINSDPKTNQSFFGGLYEMFWYSFYHPYLVYLIVPFKHFKEQMYRREARQQNLGKTVFFAVRIVIWYTLINVVLHSFYFNAMVYDHRFLDQLPRDALCSVGCAIGQYFHMKYVVIFGTQAVFAKLDKLDPPAGPICISRLMLYNKLWRYFDRGLYSFFKEYIYLPICRPTFSVPRRLLAMFTCFAFVLLWHGCTHNYVVWVLFNITEVFLEKFSRAIYNIPEVRGWRERHISDAMFRRILAVLYIVPYTLGLYSNFYFLGTSQSGYVFVKKFFWSDTLHLRYPFLVLVFLGYFFANFLIILEPYFENREAQSEDQKSSTTS